MVSDTVIAAVLSMLGSLGNFLFGVLTENKLFGVNITGPRATF